MLRKILLAVLLLLPVTAVTNTAVADAPWPECFPCN
jgi:hypothetical protein